MRRFAGVRRAVAACRRAGPLAGLLMGLLAALAGCATPAPEPAGPSAAELARVTLPDAPGTIASIVMATPELSTLAAALVRSGLDVRLERAADGFTLFAPTDAAFSTLPDGFVDRLMRDGNPARLVDFLTSSMLDEVMDDADLRGAIRRGGGRWNLTNARGTTLGLLGVPAAVDADGAGGTPGTEAAIALVDGDIGGVIGRSGPAADVAAAVGGKGRADVVVELVGGGGARVVRADIRAINGVLHVIDAVLVPRESVR